MQPVSRSGKIYRRLTFEKLAFVGPTSLIFLCACLLLIVMPAQAQNASLGSDSSPQALPDTPAPIEDIVLAKPFNLSEGYTFDWSSTAPTVRSGTILVLKVDPALVMPRDSLQPVLYAGDSPVQIISDGYPSGTLIGIVPGNIDLSEAPIWFGRPGLPERVTPEVIKEERALAERAGIAPLGEEAMARASAAAVESGDLASLLREEVADIVRDYAPEETELANRLQLPVAGAEPTPNQQ
jgi:hypothetical protein